MLLFQKPIKVNKKGIPLEVLRDEKPHKEETDVVMTTLIPTRHKGETKEEKQARKQLVKQHNKVCTCVCVCVCARGVCM